MTDVFRNATRISGQPVCKNILLVGESNPYGSDPRYALYHEPENSAGGRLQRLIFGIEARRWYLPMWRTNLCAGAWDGREARERAAELLAEDVPWSTIVMFGRKVEKAFRFDRQSPETPAFGRIDHALVSDGDGDSIRRVDRIDAENISSALRVFHLASLPHPSGRCTEWNVPGNIDRARQLMAQLVPDVPWGELDRHGQESETRP